MKNLMLALVMAFAPAALAHESDAPAAASVTAKQIELSAGLPGTVVVRRSKSNPNDVAVIHLKDKNVRTKLTNAQFEKMALNAETKGIAFDSGNELDARSSTSSWAFGFYNGYTDRYAYAYGRNGRYGYGYGGPNGYAYGRGGYGGYYGGAGYYGGYRPYYPTYNYYGYNYRYTSYYAYQDNDYYYDNCGWYY